MRCEIVAGMPPFSLIIACIAQLVEHMTFNHAVTGSIPAARIASKRREIALVFVKASDNNSGLVTE